MTDTQNAHISVNNLLHCFDCDKPVNVAVVDGETFFTCPCGKTIPTEDMDPQFVEINPITPDAWNYGDPDEQ